MTCLTVEPELLAFHFATLAPEKRLLIEQHLLACKKCLGDFLDIKRDLENFDQTADSVPSPQARQRLRSAVAKQIMKKADTVLWPWWERPLAFGFAGASVFMALFVVHALSH